MTAGARKAQLDLHKARPIRWTLDVMKSGSLDDSGRMFVFAGGPLTDAAHVAMAPKKRIDGKVDGRSAGVRKCGRCQGTGHNARTCKKSK